MKGKKMEEVIYSINVADIQDVSEDVLDRRLTKRELAKVQESVGDYIDWSQAIEHAIREHIPD